MGSLAVRAPEAIARPSKTTITNSQHHYQLSVDSSAQLDSAQLPDGLLSVAKLGPLTMTLSRIQGSNIRVWRRNQRAQFISEILAGVGSRAGVTLESSTFAKGEKPPVLDLKLSTINSEGKKQIVWMRFLFFRRYALVTSAAVPAKSPRKLKREAKRYASSLQQWVGTGK
ncbi:MAG: hypothetical protein JKY56_26045 [Kofleriaceae bacterium]|nr:hypothetical protein [Kofleriaceae bacterium]